MKPLAVGSAKVEKTQGKDCDKPEDERTNCVKIKLSYPNIEAGDEALKKSVANWATRYLTTTTALYDSTGKRVEAASLESGIKAFLDNHTHELIENEGMSTGAYLVESKDTVLLNDGKLLTLQINGTAYSGGNHFHRSVAVATFDCATAKQLVWEDLVSDKAGLKVIAEKKFMAARQDLFKPTDGTEPQKFNGENKFDLPKNYGLVKEGIFFNYEAGEIFYEVYGDTRFVLPFSEIGGISKIKN